MRYFDIVLVIFASMVNKSWFKLWNQSRNYQPCAATLIADGNCNYDEYFGYLHSTGFVTVSTYLTKIHLLKVYCDDDTYENCSVDNDESIDPDGHTDDACNEVDVLGTDNFGFEFFGQCDESAGSLIIEQQTVAVDDISTASPVDASTNDQTPSPVSIESDKTTEPQPQPQKDYHQILILQCNRS
jgi:hypothetical protein